MPATTTTFRMHVAAIGRRAWIAAPAALVTLIAAAAGAAEYDGFTEPYRTVNVGSAESGVIERLAVDEGDTVSRGDLIFELDNDVLRATLEVARAQMEVQGALQAAEAEVRLRRAYLEQLRKLRPDGHATQQEVNQAVTEFEAAEARLLAAQENLHIRRLEFERIKAQIAHRQIRAPITGVVTRLHKREGEFAALNDPVVLTIVQLERLWGVFSVDSAEARSLQLGQHVTIRIGSEQHRTVRGTVEFVSPVTDAESGTVRIKVALTNNEGNLHSGERCTLVLPPLDTNRLTRRPEN